MAAQQLETDYLILGTGAVGMAFADTLLTETDARIMMVDRHHKPGGHWNDAYPFVTLHQPAAFYGVSSRELSSGRKDEVGLNKGLYDLSSGADVLAYYDDVMRHRFLPSGRVEYFPMCLCDHQDTEGTARFHSILNGTEYEVVVTRKIIDATFLKTSVPSTHTPNFDIADGVTFMPLNVLPRLDTTPDGFVVIGGGKTGIDACLWLLEMGTDPDKITWIKSRDGWLLDRANTQPTAEFFENTVGAQAAQMESIAAADSIDDMFDKLEASGYFLRVDETVRPTMFHGATISRLELEELRRIRNVVRMGRVQQVTQTEIILDRGTIPTTPGTVHVDCSASALSPLPDLPIFEGRRITPQFVRAYQPVFSAAFIAHVEAAYGDDEAKQNALCGVVPLPDTCEDFVRFTHAAMMNQYGWSQEPGLGDWMLNNRLDAVSATIADLSPDDGAKMAIVRRMRDAAVPAVMKLQEFLTEIDGAKAA
jgi:hypothetical protein